ncbi:cobyric acid synthase [Prevotella koreensis]|uniref:cobyric acid synthase n=1 Tax=Prevotella koreensis TaxID=2490854 RepID=UPI0036F36467
MVKNKSQRERKVRAFVIAATNSGCGKTTLTIGMLRAISRSIGEVQPFKCGPDYIDTQYHRMAAGSESVNLDTFFMSKEHLKKVFAHYAKNVNVVEGVMGLWDGKERWHGSTAEVASMLSLPVVLVVNARSMAYSAAALVDGYRRFMPNDMPNAPRLAGVIFNQVGSPRHAGMLRDACRDAGMRCFGCIPRVKDMEIPSRHLGLTLDKQNEIEQLIERAAEVVEANVDMKSLLNETEIIIPYGWHTDQLWESATSFPWGDVRNEKIAVARDEAFSFVYRENIDRMRTLGQLEFFSPIADKSLPEDTTLLYLPGGYPEFFLPELSRNSKMIAAIKRYIEDGGRCLAECGGMMYLCRNIIDVDGTPYPMVGILQQDATMKGARLHLGYREMNGWRGHEFHYSEILGETKNEISPYYIYKNTIAGYMHHYWGEKRVEKEKKKEEAGRLHNVMFAGTGSDVGKSIVATAFCRIFKQDGYSPAPFKAQNMALNSYATADGLEIGRAQAVQAEAAGVECHTDMNPLLLKPNSDHTSQVVLNGKPIGNQHATEYFRREGREQLRTAVCEAFDRLSKRHNPVVMEGAGSIAEINLRDVDIVNMPMARHADADVILVSDIDRGGVFASVYGTIMLLPEEDRRRVKGIIINKFRGDMSLFEEGRKMIERLCGIPVLGVLPYLKDVHIEEEDSVSLELKNREAMAGKVNVAVVMLRHISNFTDFDTLERDPRVHLFYTNNNEEIMKADIIILPGTKSTIADLVELRRNGAAQAVMRAHRNGATVIGICGGYQIMGMEVADPQGVEGDVERMPGLGLLPLSTVMESEKTTVQTVFDFKGNECSGYEIHIGKTTDKDGVTHRSFFANDTCWGTYIHGILDNAPVIEHILAPFSSPDKHQSDSATMSIEEYKNLQYDKLADAVRHSVDMKKIYEILSGGAEE